MAAAVAAALQIFGDIVHAPGFQAAARGAIQSRREHALNQATAISLAAPVGAKDVLRRMAGAAMAGAFDQIATAIPFRALLLIGHQNARLEEQPVPAAHEDAIIQRPAQLRLTRRISHRRQRRQIGPDRENVMAGQFGEIRVGEGRVIARAVARHPEAERAIKLVVAPSAEAGIGVRRQIGRIDPAKRRIDPLSPGERFCGIGGVAAGAVAGNGQRLAARDIFGRKLSLELSVELGVALSNGERSAQQQPKENRPHCPTSSLHQLTSWRVIARKRRHAISWQASRTTQTEKGRRYFRHEIANFKKRGAIAQICSARSGKTDIDWF